MGRRRLLGVAQISLGLTFVAVAWASTLASLWPLIVALVPAGLFSGVLVSTMTARSIAVVDPSLHGAASSLFNASRLVGSAVGVAVVGPLLGTEVDMDRGFVICLLVSAAATGLTLALTVLAARAPARAKPTIG